jgi:ABC-type Fe3+ transport system substrate-binding protein
MKFASEFIKARVSIAVLLAAAVAAADARAQVPSSPAETLALARERAKKEGKLVVAGPQGRAWQVALQQFSKDVPEIKIEVTSFQGDEFWPRLQKEREVNRHLWDLRIGGINQTAWRIKDSGAFADARSMFLLPENAEEKNWAGGFSHMFLDKEKKYFPTFCFQESKTATINAEFVKPGEFPSVENLLDAKWREKIAILAPQGGSASITFALMYRHFGEGFIRKLLVDQKPIFVKDPRQAIGWLASGKYPISIGMSTNALEEYKKAGVNLDLFQPSGLRIWSPGVCALMVFEKRPNPNATLVFVNWLLSRDVQTKLLKAVTGNSRLAGVEPFDPERLVDVKSIDSYESGQTEEFADDIIKAGELVRSLLP